MFEYLVHLWIAGVQIRPLNVFSSVRAKSGAQHPVREGENLVSDPCLKVSGGVEKHQGQERKEILSASPLPPSRSDLSVCDIQQVSYHFFVVMRQKVDPTVCLITHAL